MKKLLLSFLVFVTITTLVWAGGDRERTPRVRYIEPKKQAVVDLGDKEALTFEWKSTPIPGGGRMAYKFELYKGYGYETVVSETLRERIFSIEIPADKFKDGELYTWQVKQRDARTRLWSMDKRWSFKVKK